MKNKEALTAGKKETRTKRKTDKKFTIKRERLSSWKNFKIHLQSSLREKKDEKNKAILVFHSQSEIKYC